MAGPARMTGDDIKRAMPGALLEIDTPLHISIPVKVANNGLMSAEAGALGLTLGATKDRGRWWADGDKLCMKWFRWFDAKPRCMTLQRDGNKVYWSEGSGESGTATITEAVTVAAAPVASPVAERVPAKVTEVSLSEPPAPNPVAAAPTPEPERPKHSFATAALADVTPPPKPARQAPTAKLAAVAPADVEEHVSKPVSGSRPPAPVAVQPKRRAPVAAARVPKEPYKHEQLFRVAGVESGDQLNVRNGPSEFHAAVGGIPADARKVKITGSCRDLWCPVRHGRLAGWVNRYYLAEDAAPQKAANNQR